MSEHEEWRDMPEHPGYRVSSLGQVSGRYAGKRGTVGTGGYRYVFLCCCRRRFLVHRLVVEAFIAPIPEGMQVNHKNGIKTDNRTLNLEIVTASENLRHARATGLAPLPHHIMGKRGQEHPRSRLTNEQVLQIKARLAANQFGIGAALAREFGVTPQAISHIKRGTQWAHLILPAKA